MSYIVGGLTEDGVVVEEQLAVGIQDLRLASDMFFTFCHVNLFKMSFLSLSLQLNNVGQYIFVLFVLYIFHAYPRNPEINLLMKL